MRFTQYWLLCGLLAGLWGCDRGAQKPPAAPPTTVTVSRPIRHEVIEWDDYNGRLAAVEEVEVRARVSGYLESVHFEEGTLIEQGKLLFVIDPKPIQAAYEEAKAEVQRTQAQLDYDTAEFSRIEELRQGGAVSTKEYEDARLNQRRSAAALAGAKAALQSAELNLSYTRVTAPIGGRIGRRLVTPGNLISGGADQSTLLTTIVSTDPIYCYIDADERSVLKYQRLAREQKRQSAREARIPAWMGLADESGFPHQGYIDFVNNALDPNTGTQLARGAFPNPGGVLTPGLFARLRIPGSGRYEALLIPDSAVLTDQNQKYVFLADDKNTAQYQRIEIGSLFEGLRVVTSGLDGSERVVINGQARIRANAQVNPSLVEMPLPESLKIASPTTQQVPATRPAATQPAADESTNMGGRLLRIGVEVKS